VVDEGHASPTKAVRAASLYYLRDRDSRRPAWRVPDLAPPDEGDGALLVELDDETWSALRHEAEAQGVTPELLALHALLYFLADLDSGRVRRRLGDALEE
jgi:HEAT repeat protein